MLQAQPTRPLLWTVGAGIALLAVALGTRALPRAGNRRAEVLRRVLVVLVAGVLLGSAVASVQVARLHPPIAVTAATGAVVLRAEATVTGDPRAHHAVGDSHRPSRVTWTVAVRLHRVTIRARSHTVRIPALLRGDQVSRLRYGQDVALVGRASPAWAPQVHGLTLNVLGEVAVRSPPGPLARMTNAIRASFRTACAGLPPDAGALLLGLAVGDESTVSPELDRAMIRSGLAHLTAVSGSNTSLVVGIAMAGVAGLGLGWRSRVAACAVVLAGYVALVRPEPSVLRAAGMGVVALIALSTGGQRRGPPALLASGLGLLLALPQFALSMGFALSFAATAALLVVGPPLASLLAAWRLTRWVPEPVRAALAVAAAAHLATLPLVMTMGNGASLVALPANVLVTPLVPVATVLGLAAALLAPLAALPAQLLASAASPATWLIAAVAHVAAGVPGGVIDVTPDPRGAWAIAVCVVLVCVGVVRGWSLRWHRGRLAVAAGVAAALLVAGQLRASHWPPHRWVVLACDVGQGDGLLLRREGSPDALLVDTGPDGDAIASCLHRAGVRRLAVLITHYHADHIEGLASVLRQWTVTGVLVTPYPQPRAAAARVARLAQEAGVPVRPVRVGADVAVMDVHLQVLWPTRPMAQSPANNASVVALATLQTSVGGLRVLLTGDIEPEAQAVLRARVPPDAAIVKVPHHGSAEQDPWFAAWSGAEVALISVGEGNEYGHPGADTIAQYRDAGALVARTDHHGSLAVVPGGAGFVLVTQRRSGA